MNDDRTDLEVFQQCRDLVFRESTSAANMCQRQVASTNGEARALVRSEYRPSGSTAEADAIGHG
jgi:hypothetical protein